MDLKTRLGLMSLLPLTPNGGNAFVGLTLDLMFELGVWGRLVGVDQNP